MEQEEQERQSTGSGIGLSLVRDFVTLHEGTVRVVDNVGSGSVFLIELPVKHVHVSPSKPAPLAEEVEEHEELCRVWKRNRFRMICRTIWRRIMKMKREAVGPDCG